VRDDVQNLKDSIPRALNNQKDLTDTRLREVNAELKSLKTLITQRMNPTATSASVSNYLRPTVTSAGSPPAASPATPATPAPAESASTPEASTPAPVDPLSSGRRSPFNSGMQSKASIPAWQMMASKTAAASSSPAAATNGTASEGSSSESKEASGSA